GVHHFLFFKTHRLARDILDLLIEYQNQDDESNRGRKLEYGKVFSQKHTDGKASVTGRVPLQCPLRLIYREHHRRIDPRNQRDQQRECQIKGKILPAEMVDGKFPGQILAKKRLQSLDKHQPKNRGQKDDEIRLDQELRDQLKSPASQRLADAHFLCAANRLSRLQIDKIQSRQNQDYQTDIHQPLEKDF